MSDKEKLIILVNIYRAQVKYMLDSFVSTENASTEFWMEIMDTYAIEQVIDKERVEYDVITE